MKLILGADAFTPTYNMLDSEGANSFPANQRLDHATDDPWENFLVNREVNGYIFRRWLFGPHENLILPIAGMHNSLPMLRVF